MEENKELVVQDNYTLSDFTGLGRSTNTKTEVYTNITDSKKLFNLENNVDCLLNDCEGQTIRVKDVLIKRYEKPLENPIFDKDTGELIKDIEVTMSCVLVDTDNLSYATGSKVFTITLIRYLQARARMQEQEEYFDIKIIKKKMQNGNNKALSFELV